MHEGLNGSIPPQPGMIAPGASEPMAPNQAPLEQQGTLGRDWNADAAAFGAIAEDPAVHPLIQQHAEAWQQRAAAEAFGAQEEGPAADAFLGAVRSREGHNPQGAAALHNRFAANTPRHQDAHRVSTELVPGISAASPDERDTAGALLEVAQDAISADGISQLGAGTEGAMRPEVAQSDQLRKEVTAQNVQPSDYNSLADSTRHAPEGLQAVDSESYHQVPESVVTASGYIEQNLHRQEVVDANGLERPVFEIAGHTIMFRNRQEAPLLTDRSVAVVGGDITPPLQLEAADGNPADISTVTTYNQTYAAEHQPDAEGVLVVTNTPEGMVAAARMLAKDESVKQDLDVLATVLREGKYAEPTSMEAIDGILAAISIDDEGQPTETYLTDGYALALAALAGDTHAQQLVGTKRAELHAQEARRRAEIRAHDIEWGERLEAQGVKALPPKQIALVHSTSYDIERDTDGNVVLFSAASKRSDRYPRASLHFTLNSQVAPHAQAVDAWGMGNNLIVANLAAAMEASGREPEVLYGSDTWFANNPGEHLTLPGALVVHAAPEGQLLQESETDVSFLGKPDYTQEELREIDRMAESNGVQIRAGQTPQETLKEVAVRRALQRQGVPPEAMDAPSTDGHGMSNTKLAERVYLTGAQMGVRVGRHFDMQESRAEQDVHAAMHREYIGFASTVDTMSDGQFTFLNSSLQARRQFLVSGYVPSRPNTLDHAAANFSLDVEA